MHKIVFLLLPLLASACTAPMPMQPQTAAAPAPVESRPVSTAATTTRAAAPATRSVTPTKPVVVSNVPAPAVPSKPAGLRARTDLTFTGGGGAASGPAVIDLR
ncbi:hypothetical protein [Paracoccus sp. ME4]|uniref:hypothetical protein n=1 Tax=Paracoccus sp. ME4 TaxID=3138066 RepID=UPI00398B33C1